MRLLDHVLDLFYPTICAGCSEALVGGEQVLCLSCSLDLPFTRFHDDQDNVVEQRLKGRFEFEAASSLLFFHKKGRVQQMLHSLKYHRNEAAGLFMGRLLADELRASDRFATVESVVPVPLHPRKLKVRGYNQSDVIAQGMEERGFIKRENALQRLHDNSSQTRKDTFQRWKNVEGIFDLGDGSGLQGKHVLLLDDVLTTGATLEACAKALLKIPDIKLYVATVACAEH